MKIIEAKPMQTSIANHKPIMAGDETRKPKYFFLYDKVLIDFNAETNQALLSVIATSTFEDGNKQKTKSFELSTISEVKFENFSDSENTKQVVIDFIQQAFNAHVTETKAQLVDEKYSQQVVWSFKDQGKFDAYIDTVFKNAFVKQINSPIA